MMRLLQRDALLQETYDDIQEVAAHLFVPRKAPERPSQGFFKGFFGDGYTALDREELCELNVQTFIESPLSAMTVLWLASCRSCR